MEACIDKDQLIELFASWQPSFVIKEIVSLTGDASLRRYYRIIYQTSQETTLDHRVVAMVFDSVAAPEAGDASEIASNDAYRELSRMFAGKGILVPQFYGEAAEGKVFFIEDIGDDSLGTLFARESEPDVIGQFYAAIGQLVEIQGIGAEDFPYKRSFTPEIYIREMQEFSDYFLAKDSGVHSLTQALYSTLAAELDSYPKVLVHRDFHAWNLFLDHARRVRVIDFQDALWGNRCYDIASLLNDRGTDSLLGMQDVRLGWRYFHELVMGDDSWEEEYLRCLLQRDLKVVGRFSKLSKERGLVDYEKWIPDTLVRIGRVLNTLKVRNSKPCYSEFLLGLEDESPEVHRGASDEIKF